MTQIPPMDIPANMLAGKNIAITGATTGIGRGIAKALIQAGANLAVLYLPVEQEEANAKSLAKELAEIRGNDKGVLLVAGDVAEQETAVNLVAKTVEAFGEINGMIANAGICKYHDFFETSKELYYQHIRINLDGVYFMVQEAGRQMKKQGKGGSIVCTGSIRSLLGGAGGNLVPYTATKGGVLSIVQASAAALGPYNIRVNCLMPGAVETPIVKENLAEEEKLSIISRIPMNRMGIPEDLAGPAIFLCSDLSRFCNGAQMLVDGGQYINLE